MSGPRVWVDENDLRLLVDMALAYDDEITNDMRVARLRVKAQLDQSPPPPLRPYRACMQGHGA